MENELLISFNSHSIRESEFKAIEREEILKGRLFSSIVKIPQWFWLQRMLTLKLVSKLYKPKNYN